MIRIVTKSVTFCAGVCQLLPCGFFVIGNFNPVIKKNIRTQVFINYFQTNVLTVRSVHQGVVVTDETPVCPKIELKQFATLITNEENKLNVKKFIEEYEAAKVSNRRVPSNLNVDTMEELLKLESKSQRLRYLAFLFIKEKTELNRKIKKEIKLKEKQLKQSEKDEVITTHNHIKYGLGKTTLFIRICSSSMNKWYGLKQANALIFGQNIVIDLDYEKYMLRREVKNSAEQLTVIFSANRSNRYPFCLHICNARKDAFLMEWLMKLYPALNSSVDCFVNCTELSYLDLFPKEKLVYLSPHAKETLQHYDPTAIYIIGAFVDVAKQLKISNKKAEDEGIKSYRLPLDEYIMWGQGSKCLSINQVFEIMLEMKNTDDWKKALTFVPRRKIKKLDTSNFDAEELPDKIFVTPLYESNKN